MPINAKIFCLLYHISFGLFTLFLQSLSLAAIAAYAYAQIAPGSNAYLPPTKNGYDYPEPNKPFVSMPATHSHQ